MYATSKTIRLRKNAQPHNTQVAEECKVAMFDPVVVQEELEYHRPTPLKQLFSLKTLKVNIIGQTWHFLLTFVVLYYIIQVAYQFDLLCRTSERKVRESSTQMNSSAPDTCTKRVMSYFAKWDENEKIMTRIITFLLGFYVSAIAKRWWDQVSKLPDVDYLGLVLGGLVWVQPGPGPASAEAALYFKKTVIRYVLLSWTMCLSRISSPLRSKFFSAQDFIEKNLLTRSEADALKLDSDNCTAKWWVPLSWAVSMVNDAFNNKVKGKDGLIPKDHKDVITVICKLRNDLHLLAEYRLKPLPAIYKQAVWVAVWGWVLMGTFANQNTIHHRDAEAKLMVTIVLSFPGHQLLMYMLVFGWLKVADILSNPFGSDQDYDVNLASTLDLNIWKASVTIENQEKAIHSQLLKNPYAL